MKPIHENETGVFQELAHASYIKFGQLSILSIKPKCARGGHYHTRKEEWFCCIHGKCEVRLENIQNGATRKIILEDTHREFMKVMPRERHYITNLSDSEACELLVIISEEYDPHDPDTFEK